MSQTLDRKEQIGGLRDLARQARRLSQGLSDDDRRRLLKHAEDLEQQATSLEGSTEQAMAPPSALATVVQLQVQQQQEVGPPAAGSKQEKPQN
jgi:hypothetical protein